MEIQPDKYRNTIPPPPVVLVSTIYKDVKNVAPYGMNTPVSFNPPLYAIAASGKRDTCKNIIETKEFVVGVPGPELVKAINIAGESFPRDVSEFEKAGLTPVKSSVVKPSRIKECQSNFECKLEWVKEAGDHYLIVGKVVAAWIEDRLFTEELSRLVIDPVYHVSSKTKEYAGKGPLIE